MLRLSDVSVHYGMVHALKGISLTVPAGSVVALLGANGAGKSTTLKTISGLLRPSAGKVEFEGQDITRWPAERIVAAGVVQVPEGRQIFSELTVFENLKIGAYTRRDNKGVKEDLDRVYHIFPVLKERHGQMAGTLSGGEQQMLAIGRALMARPRLLLLDEPSLGLAPMVTREIFKVIRRINETGTTILLVEQNARQALAVSHYGYVLETGKVALGGESSALMNDEEVIKSYLGGRRG